MKTSVVIPCYKVDEFLDEAIFSVAKQSRPVKELIVVDDGSPEPLRVRDNWDAPGKLIWVRTENRGLGAARNEGIKRASGEFVAFLDSDDFWEPTKIQEQEDFLDGQPKAVACYTQCVKASGFFPFGPYTDPKLSRDQLAKILWYGQIFPPSSVCMRSSVAKGVQGFREGLRNGEDLDFWFRIMEHGEIYGIDKPLTWYRMHESQLTKDPIRRVMGSKESRREIIEKYSHRLIQGGILPSELWHAYRDEILSVYFRRDHRHARPMLWDYYRDHPREFKILIYYLISYLPGEWVARFRGRIGTQ
jgi:glycosyltransferase involved in cell wall biosynthesis